MQSRILYDKYICIYLNVRLSLILKSEHANSCSSVHSLPVCLLVSHHVLHTDTDLPITIEGSIEAHNVGGIALMQHLQLSDDLVSDGGLDFQVDQLWKENGREKKVQF